MIAVGSLRDGPVSAGYFVLDVRNVGLGQISGLTLSQDQVKLVTIGSADACGSGIHFQGRCDVANR
jgi:hypothetical protein